MSANIDLNPIINVIIAIFPILLAITVLNKICDFGDVISSRKGVQEELPVYEPEPEPELGPEPETTQGDWTCQYCGAKNPEYKYLCQHCGAYKR